MSVWGFLQDILPITARQEQKWMKSYCAILRFDFISNFWPHQKHEFANCSSP